MYSVIYTKAALKVLRKQPPQIAKRIKDSIDELAQAPQESEHVTKLQGREGYRLRVGGWRVIFDLENEQLIITVIKISPRGDAYKH